MCNFLVQGVEKYDFYTVNGSMDWAIVPAGTIKYLNQETPIRVQVGDYSWGYIHTAHKHRDFLSKNKSTLEELFYKKLGQSGSIYSTEEDKKFKISMRLSPSVIVLLRYIPKGEFLTLVTMYQLNRRLDGIELGRYRSEFRI